ncbi:MAG: phage tail sheath subtilisin-like domain-containing protein [Oscillospiraceae bacterium]|nr:phage tail sheath subtilisin-like domain-containing protein [Oscillospiraceae bacterium]
MSVNERPGVYTNINVSGGILGSGGGKAVGLAAQCDTAQGVKRVTGYLEAVSAFGASSTMAKLAKVLFENGAGEVYCAAVADGDYEAAFALLMEKSEVKFMICDSADGEVHDAMREAIEKGDEKSKYRLGVVETALSARDEIIAAAKALNCEKICLVSHHDDEMTGAAAAAVCGAFAAQEDPAVPFNGAQLYGIGDIGSNFSDADIAALVQGGVMPLETIGGSKVIVRGITTRSETGGVQDNTWREVNTILIVNSIIPEIRDGLRAKFARAKNTAQTRGAVRTQVTVALEDKRKKEIIDSYGQVSVKADESDPTVCIVEFSFAVAHGMNRIELMAYITV